MKGHTDRATVNQRRDLSSGMADLLRAMHRTPRGVCAGCDNAAKNRLRALMDRGYAHPPESPGGYWTLTEAGRKEAERQFGPYL